MTKENYIAPEILIYRNIQNVLLAGSGEKSASYDSKDEQNEEGIIPIGPDAARGFSFWEEEDDWE